MAIPTNTAELLEALKGLQGSSAEEDAAERKNYRYVIYVRKSTDDKDKQVRSLGNQIILCKQFAKDIGAGDPDVVQESESAKESNKRPKFRQILLDISNKKMKELDYVVKKIFSNFSVKGKKVEIATLNTPFDELYAKNVQNSGR